MSKFVSTAAALPDFSPSLGHTYMPPPSANRSKASDSQLSQASKENTPLPDTLGGSKKVLVSSDSSNFLSSRLLEESLQISLKYGDEYMDENPITGQPGDFHLSTTGRKDKEKLAVPPSIKGPLTSPATTSTVPVPHPIKTDITPTRKGGKGDKSPKTPGSGIPKLKRKKTKTPGGSGAVSPV